MSHTTTQPPDPMTPTIPVGAILPFIGNSFNIPNGWLLCNEAGIKSAQKTGYQEITVPNLDGVTLIGQGSTYSLNQQGGEATHTLSVDEMPSHDHKYTYNNMNTGDSTLYPAGKTCGSHNNGNLPFTTSTVGGGNPHNNMQPYYVVYYIMYIGIATSAGLCS